jgi:homoserine O-acetyltransferase
VRSGTDCAIIGTLPVAAHLGAHTWEAPMLARKLLWLVPALVALPLQAQDLQVVELGECALESGEVLAPCDLAYRTYGELNAARDNAILISTWWGGTSASWTGILGSGLIDLAGFYTIVVDAFGNGVSTSPTTSPTQGGEAFPLISIGDMVHSQHRLVTDVMELDGLYAVMGFSMGGMQTFEWLVEYPGFFDKAVAISGSPRLGPYDIARWETGLHVLELFEACECEAAAAAYAGLSILTSNSPEYQARVTDRTTVQTVLAQQARQSVQRWSGGRTKDIASQTRAMINLDISRGFGGDMAAAAAAIQAELLVIVNAVDHVVTPGPALEFAELAGAQTVVLDDDCGHLSALRSCSGTEMTVAISAFLARDD